MVTSETEAIEGKASPLNPSVRILNKSLELYIFEVACRLKANPTWSAAIPLPLSIT